MPTSDRKALAERCGTTEAHMRNVAYGKPCSPELAAAIERETSGQVTRPEMRPADWHKIWPELHAVYPSLLSLMTSKRRRNSLHAARAAAE